MGCQSCDEESEAYESSDAVNAEAKANDSDGNRDGSGNDHDLTIIISSEGN